MFQKNIYWAKLLSCKYRVFIKYCVFFQEFLKVCHLSLASTRLLLVVQKITANRSDCTLALRWELWRSSQQCRGGRGCSELWKNTIFPEHPVCESVGDIGKCVLKSKEYKAYKNMTTVEDFWMKWEILIFFSTNMYTNFEYYLVSTFSLYWFNYGWSGNDYGIPFLQTHYVQILKRILPCLYL